MTTGKRLIGTLRKRIETGVYARGGPLPSSRYLATELNADRGTITRAMEVLRKQGLVKKVSPRLMVVNEEIGRSAGDQLVGQTVAMVAVGSRFVTSHHQPGWVEFIGLGALPAIEQAGMHTLSFHPAKLRDSGIDPLIRARPYGVIFSDLLSETGEEAMLGQLSKAGIPFVVYGNRPSLAAYDRVSSDQEVGSYLLTQLLIKQGRRRIACCWYGWGQSPWLVERYEGYRRAMTQAGLEPLPVIEVPAPGVVADAAAFDHATRTLTGYMAPHLLAPSSVDALMLNSDGDVPYAAAACRPLRLTPNLEVALVGYDHYWADSPERQYEDTPPLATIDKCNTRMGEALVQLLCDRIEQRLDEQPTHRIIKPQLVVPVA